MLSAKTHQHDSAYAPDVQIRIMFTLSSQKNIRQKWLSHQAVFTMKTVAHSLRKAFEYKK